MDKFLLSNFFGLMLYFLVTFYNAYEVKCDQKVEYRDHKKFDSKNFSTLYRQEILTSELEREKLFRFSHIDYAYVGKTE